MGAANGIANNKVKYKAGGVKKKTLLRDKKNVMVGKVKKSSNKNFTQDTYQNLSHGYMYNIGRTTNARHKWFTLIW